MAKNILRFKDKRQSDITKFLRTHLNFSISSAKELASHMAKSEQDNFTTEDILRIARDNNLNLYHPDNKDVFTVQTNEFKFPKGLDETQLEYMIWLNRKEDFHTNKILFHEMTIKEWEEYLYTEHHCTRDNSIAIAKSMHMYLHGGFISPQKTPLHPL